MLVLSRKKHQFIILKCPGGIVVRVRVEEFRHEGIRLSIQAPADVLILRGPELCDEEGNERAPA